MHSELYFLDGDIVLSAVNTCEDGKPILLLRVHKFMLSHHSVVFKDMFAFPSIPQVNEVYDGVSLVRMPDNASDLIRLIGALYNPQCPYPLLIRVLRELCASC